MSGGINGLSGSAMTQITFGLNRIAYKSAFLGSGFKFVRSVRSKIWMTGRSKDFKLRKGWFRVIQLRPRRMRLKYRCGMKINEKNSEKNSCLNNIEPERVRKRSMRHISPWRHILQFKSCS